jgi:hypothetical protein
MTVKYVIVIDAEGNESPIVFHKSVAHNTISNRNGNIISAGFATKAMTGKWFANGASESLNLKSRPVEDGVLLNKFFDYII